MRFSLVAGAAAAAALLAGACGGGGDNQAGENLRLGLQSMVLQADDLPQHLQSLGGSFADNEAAASGLGAGPAKEQLDAWGRILGYSVDYQATAPQEGSSITALSTSTSLYRTPGGASESFVDRINSARAADWQESHADLMEFQQREIQRDLGVDDYLWLRFTGYQQIGPERTRLIANDVIVFRIGRSWGFLGIVSTAAEGEDDRDFMLPQAETLVHKQIERVRNGLYSDLLG
jgi:hypothetical protein